MPRSRLDGTKEAASIVRAIQCAGSPAASGRPARGRKCSRQVSWLAGRCAISLPSAFAPVASLIALAAHSCGGSSGFASRLTGFPLSSGSESRDREPLYVGVCSALLSIAGQTILLRAPHRGLSRGVWCERREASRHRLHRITKFVRPSPRDLPLAHGSRRSRRPHRRRAGRLHRDGRQRKRCADARLPRPAARISAA
jgi:hypothetical protein